MKFCLFLLILILHQEQIFIVNKTKDIVGTNTFIIKNDIDFFK